MRMGILTFLKIRMNDKKSIEEFLSDISVIFYNMYRYRSVHLNIVWLAQYLAEEDLHFFSEQKTQ